MGWCRGVERVVVGSKTGVLIGLIIEFHCLGLLSAAGQTLESGARLRPTLMQPFGEASALPQRTRSHNRRTQPFDANGNVVVGKLIPIYRIP